VEAAGSNPRKIPIKEWRLLSESALKPMISRVNSPAINVFLRRNACLATALFAASVTITGCSTQRGRATALDEAARSLLPQRAHVLLQGEGNCVELARSPSCIQAYFLADDPALGERVRAVQRRARKASWEIRRRERLAGGVELRFHRDRFNAIVTLRTDWFRRHGCDELRAKDCADVISVERN
jgi:hypothetical protein